MGGGRDLPMLVDATPWLGCRWQPTSVSDRAQPPWRPQVPQCCPQAPMHATMLPTSATHTCHNDAHTCRDDHRGYGRLWNTAIQECKVFAVRHRGLAGAAALALNRGAMSMANEYALALVAAFLSGPFDLIGASFGAILASHVSYASKAAGGRPRRLVLIDPPPSISKALPVPKMATSLRTAAMGVLLIHLHIEMGASVWAQFPQLQTLPDGEFAFFVD